MNCPGFSLLPSVTILMLVIKNYSHKRADAFTACARAPRLLCRCSFLNAVFIGAYRQDGRAWQRLQAFLMARQQVFYCINLCFSVLNN